MDERCDWASPCPCGCGWSMCTVFGTLVDWSDCQGCTEHSERKEEDGQEDE